MTHQEHAAESAIAAANQAASLGNPRNAIAFWRIAASHLEQAARAVPCVRGVPTDDNAKHRIAKRYRQVLDHVMRGSRVDGVA